MSSLKTGCVVNSKTRRCVKSKTSNDPGRCTRNARTRRCRKTVNANTNIVVILGYRTQKPVENFLNRCIHNVPENVLQQRIFDFDSSVLSYFTENNQLKNNLAREVLELANYHDADKSASSNSNNRGIPLKSVKHVIYNDELLKAVIQCKKSTDLRI